MKKKTIRNQAIFVILTGAAAVIYGCSSNTTKDPALTDTAPSAATDEVPVADVPPSDTPAGIASDTPTADPIAAESNPAPTDPSTPPVKRHHHVKRTRSSVINNPTVEVPPNPAPAPAESPTAPPEDAQAMPTTAPPIAAASPEPTFSPPPAPAPAPPQPMAQPVAQKVPDEVAPPFYKTGKFFMIIGIIFVAGVCMRLLSRRDSM